MEPSLSSCAVELEMYSINKVDYQGDNVAVAAYHCSFRRLIELVKQGADINMADDSDVGYGATALDFLATVPTYVTDVDPGLAAKVMQWLINHGADVNKQDHGGKTALHFFGKFGGSMDQLRVLLDNNIDVNLGMNYGDEWTPLWYVRNYRTSVWRQVEEELLRHRARQKPRELDYQMPQEWTLDCIEQSSISDYDGQNVAEAAAKGAYGDLCRLVEARGNVNETWSDHTSGHGALSALHYVAAAPGLLRDVEPADTTRLIKWLLHRKAAINDTGEDGSTPLHLSARYCAEHTDSLTALLEARADINKAMRGERHEGSIHGTPLQYSRKHNTCNRSEVRHILLQWGAHPNGTQDEITDSRENDKRAHVGRTTTPHSLQTALSKGLSSVELSEEDMAQTWSCTSDYHMEQGRRRRHSSQDVAELLRIAGSNCNISDPSPVSGSGSRSQRTAHRTDASHKSKLNREFQFQGYIADAENRAITLEQLRRIVSFARMNCHDWHELPSDLSRKGAMSCFGIIPDDCLSFLAPFPPSSRLLTMEDESFVVSLPHKLCPAILEETYAEWGGKELPCIQSERDAFRIVRLKPKGVFGQLGARIRQSGNAGALVQEGDRIVSVNGIGADTEQMIAEMNEAGEGSIDIKISRGDGNMNLYHANDWIIKPATKEANCSMVELLTHRAQPPEWFVSHWWGDTITSCVRCVARHGQIRALPGTAAYWICAYANRQHDLGQDLTQDPRDSSFYRAMKKSVGLLLILDKETSTSGPATPLKRVWCCFEEYMALDEEFNKDRSATMLVDVATCLDRRACVLTDGVAPIDGVGYQADTAKTRRESAFPFEILRPGLKMSIEDAQASKPDDKMRILNLIANRPLSRPYLQQHENYNRVNKWIQANSAVLLWMSAVKLKTIDEWGLPEAISADTKRRTLIMSFQGNRQIGDDVLISLGRALPSGLKFLELNFCSCLRITDVGVRALASRFPKGLQKLRIDFGSVHNITSEGAFALSSGIGQINKLDTVKLCFDECRQVDDAFMAKLSSQLPATAIRELELKFYFGAFGDVGLSDFGKNLPCRLETLKFDAVAVNKVTDQGARSFVKSFPDSLRRVNFDFNGTNTDPQFRLVAKSNDLNKIRAWALASSTIDSGDTDRFRDAIGAS
eukprot:TRINITY_DN31393_c0_g1_i1.p1 TRINITY_DN31393_c0_g1~~TRINITY_DN31393_c0_g1_i1.p1  ORF type:complete len:1146 (-),score=148.99 TRINITY_DN31393_c0_g1_i1:126-3563(-)